MLEALILALILQAPNAAEYESEQCPGETRARFVATRPNLTIHTRPDKNAPPRSIPFRKGWLVAYDRCLYRTITGIDLVTSASVSATCGDDFVRIQLQPGENVRYLQYIFGRSARVRVNGTVCYVDLDPKAFSGTESRPTTESWIRVVNADGTAAGWLLIRPDEDQHNFQWLPGPG